MNNEVSNESNRHSECYQSTDQIVAADFDSLGVQKISDTNLKNYNLRLKKQRDTLQAINRKKSCITITKDTIVYEIPGIGDKFKNYEKITKEIKPFELEIRKENKKKNYSHNMKMKIFLMKTMIKKQKQIKYL